MKNQIFNLLRKKIPLHDCRQPGNSLLGFRDDPGFDENSVARVGDVDDFAAAVHLSSVVYGLGEFRVKASILLYNILVLSALSTFFYSSKFLSTVDCQGKAKSSMAAAVLAAPLLQCASFLVVPRFGLVVQAIPH